MTFRTIVRQTVFLFKESRMRFFRRPSGNTTQLIRNAEASILILSVLLFLLFSLPENKSTPLHTLNEIRQEGELHIGVQMNPLEYYVREGKVCGFAREAGKILADSLQVEAVFHVYYTQEDAALALLQNEVDLMAILETPSPEGAAFFSYTRPLFYSDIVCLHAKSLKEDSIRDFGYVAAPSFLQQAARMKKRFSQWRLHQYRASADQLLEAVNAGKLDATLSLGIFWRAYVSLFPKIQCTETLQDSLPLCWTVRRGNDSLLAAVDTFLSEFSSRKAYRILCKKYMDPHSMERSRMSRNARRMPFGSISRYDADLKKYSAEYGLDWQLLAALIYQESRFNSQAVGNGNTFGLMQFTTGTGARYGVSIGTSAERQIMGGCRYVSALSKKIEKLGVTDSAQRIPMVIAAYNAGGGHLEDAVALARAEKHLDHTQWEGGVKEALLLLGERKYYRKPAVRHGSYHGARHTLRYVQSVTGHFEHYKAVGQRDSLVEVR